MTEKLSMLDRTADSIRRWFIAEHVGPDFEPLPWEMVPREHERWRQEARKELGVDRGAA